MPDIGQHLQPLSSTAVSRQDERCSFCHVQLYAHECVLRNQWQSFSVPCIGIIAWASG